MKRIKIAAPFEVLVEDVETLMVPPADGVIVRALVTGISAGTERMWYDGSSPALVSGRRSYPYYPGYEFVGQIVVAGDQVANAKVGDRVFAMVPHAEYAVLGPNALWTVLPERFDSEAALAIALTATGVHAIHQAKPQMGDSVAVVGLGVVGLIAIQVAKAAGAGQVIAIGRSQWKRDLAAALGADHVLDAGDPALVRRVQTLTEGRGVDVAIECAGASEAVGTATSVTRSQGRVVIEGFHTRPFAVSGEDIFSKELTIVGVRSIGSHEASEFNRWSRRANFDLACALVLQGKVKNAPVITHRLPVAEIAKGYDLIHKANEPYLQILLEW